MSKVPGLGAILACCLCAFLFVEASTPTTANASVKQCGKVKDTRIRVAKGSVSRKKCRSVARRAIKRIFEKQKCGQWNNPDQPMVCRIGRWRCSWPTAGTQQRANLIAFCAIPKGKRGRAGYKPKHFKKLIKIGTTR